jgi:hypothetical protein
MLTKRTLKIGEYDTAARGWTLAACTLSDPEQKTHYVEKTAGDGSWDLSTVVTDGIPRYKNRTLTAVLECSVGTRTERTALISDMINGLDGYEWPLVLPDYPLYYLTGRIRVTVNYHELAHSSVTVTANCAPWLYKAQETVISLAVAEEERQAVLSNAGRRALVPLLTVTGTALLKYGTSSITLTDVTDESWPTLLLTPGDHTLKYKGSGRLDIKYREAVLK